MAPAPTPLESMQNVGYLPAGQEGGPRMNTISLSVLIDFIIQRTYHELTVLAELLPRKSDMERKIEIFDFSARTRQLFIRLIALVKWANSVSKVDKSANIMSFLDKQNMLFIETADLLALTSRETLVRARLPSYHIPAAVEVLTTGNYNRLPTSIREKILPPEPITNAEKKHTLMRLNQVIQHRLVTGKVMQQLRDFKIKDGRVTFEVKNEFTASLTVMGDSPNLPWRLLDINILVEDKETGDGRALVHPLQVHYIHQLVQVRLAQNPNPLNEVYNCLHFFCQSLQLEVLYTQTLRLNYERLEQFGLNVEEYVPGSKITVSYWRELTMRDPKLELVFRVTVQTDPSEIGRPLAVVHVPSLGAKESAELADRAIRSESLSIERLIVHTVYIRSVSRLNDLKLDFQNFLKDVDLNLQGTPAVLMVPVLTPCLRAEQIHITIDTHTGLMRCHVPKHIDCPIMAEMQICLNGDRQKLQKLVTELRYWITHRRCEKTLQHLPATITTSMPFLEAPDNKLLKGGRNKLLIKLHRHPNIILVVQLSEKPNTPNEIDYTFHLAIVSYQSFEKDEHVHDDPNSQAASLYNQSTASATDIPKFFTKLTAIIEFDTFVATHGPGTEVEDVSPHKRRGIGCDMLGPPAKLQKTIYPAYFVPELAHVVAMCDEQIPFLNLAEALTKNKITHTGVQVEANSTSLVLNIVQLPKPLKIPRTSVPSVPQLYAASKIPEIEEHIWNDLEKRLLSVSVRSQMNKNNQIRAWVVEFVFLGTPLASTHQKEQGTRRTVCLTYEQLNNDFSKTVEDLLNDWSKIVYIYMLVYNFAEYYNNERLNLTEIVTVKSYSYMNLLLGYGPKKEVTCNIYWSVQSQGFRLTFVGGITAVNAHSIIRDQLVMQLNHQYNLVTIVQILHETYYPLSYIAKLPIMPQLAQARPNVPVLSFSIIPQSPLVIRLIFQAVNCLEIRMRGGRLVSIRDGAFSQFDRSLIDDFTPIQGLKTFLSKYIDENTVYRGTRTQSEDDNPPSPIVTEDPFAGASNISGAGAGGSSPFLSTGLRGPQSPRDSALRFPAPHTPPSSSNPHTPASPHPAAAVGTGNTPGGGSVQSHPNFNLTSPPAPHMPHPSPGGLMPSSPLNPQPSPHMVHSPGPNTLYMAGHQDSPFTAMSPANTNWPGSPSMPRPSPRPGQSPEHKPGGGGLPTLGMSRTPTMRCWAGAVPTLLTYEALETICRPSPHPIKELAYAEMSPLERFLGCVYMRRQLQRTVQAEENLTQLTTTEPGVVVFKADGLQCHVTINPVHMQSLHLKITALPSPPTPDGKNPFQLTPDDLQIIEQFFDMRVAAPPYRPIGLNGFCRALNCAPQVIKDFVQIMRLDLKPDLSGEQYKWTVQFCMRVPPSAAPIVPTGNSGVLICRLKILFFLHITRIPYNGKDWKDSPSMVLPMVYDMQSNLTQLAERREQVPTPSATAASALLRRFAEYSMPHGQCSLFPAVRDLLMNLQLPNDIPQPNPGIAQPVVVVGASPNQMIQNPIQQLQQIGAYPQMGAGNVPQ